MPAQLIEFAVPSSVESVCSLDDSSMCREIGVEYVRRDRRKRAVLRGTTVAFVNVIDTCLLMAADHGSEEPTAYNAGKWAKRQAVRAVALRWAVWCNYGGLSALDTSLDGGK